MDEHCSDCPKLDGMCTNKQYPKRRSICKGCESGKKLMDMSTPLWGDAKPVSKHPKAQTSLTEDMYKQLRGSGLSNKDIAHKVGLSYVTVYKYIKLWGLTP